MVKITRGDHWESQRNSRVGRGRQTWGVSGGLQGLLMTAAPADCFQESQRPREGWRIWEGHQVQLGYDPGSWGVPREEFGEDVFRMCCLSPSPPPVPVASLNSLN